MPPAFEGGDFYGQDGDSTVGFNMLEDNEFYMARAKLLAEAIPAVSYAAGANIVDAFDEPLSGDRNFDMSTLYRDRVGDIPVWPSERTKDEDFRWKHGDIHRVALPFLDELYFAILEKGKL